jgi:hypothetical protein
MAALVAGCGGSAAPSARRVDARVAAVESWFFAINHKDLAGAEAAFLPADRSQMDWENGETSGWPTFSDLRCKLMSSSSSQATVYCSFDESQAAAEGNPDTFWTVELSHSVGHWLITGYGQG